VNRTIKCTRCETVLTENPSLLKSTHKCVNCGERNSIYRIEQIRSNTLYRAIRLLYHVLIYGSLWMLSYAFDRTFAAFLICVAITAVVTVLVYLPLFRLATLRIIYSESSSESI